ncbi:MAG: S-methyl-5-thioribose-1-phosphate isomerase [Pseudohongiellaceae bacterium]|nr:S-methyl-5-thioribose-1-phosphate isomerase [Pseudohongiellaceae bacterium]
MRVNEQQLRTIEYDAARDGLTIIDQTRLPHHFETVLLRSLGDVCHAISTMQVRGAPLIGVTAAYGLYFALRDGDASLSSACRILNETRPTAVNLAWALTSMSTRLETVASAHLASEALVHANALAQEDAMICEAIGEQGLSLLQEAWEAKKAKDGDAQALNILTHCNAGWLATVDWGTALAPIYKAKLAGIPVHVWVDETRPRNQGAFLTAWELKHQGIPHTVIVDNAGGHLMQNGLVDLCIVGSDRTTIRGDVCNKIGTYLKALAAADNHIPFYVALPLSTIDASLHDGLKEIPIEQRSASEITHMQGIDEHGELRSVQVALSESVVDNAGFDVTPARLVTALITEKGIALPNESSLRELLAR